jgi:hypothetical protein
MVQFRLLTESEKKAARAAPEKTPEENMRLLTDALAEASKNRAPARDARNHA